MAKLQDVAFPRGTHPSFFEFYARVQQILNSGRYQMRVLSTIPDWTTFEGEVVLYAKEEVRALYAYINSQWVKIAWTGGSADVGPIGFIGLEIADTANNDTVVTIRPGRGPGITKTENTELRFDRASDWFDSTVYSWSGGAGWCYIGYNTVGNLKLLASNAPNADNADRDSVTGATKLYYDDTIGVSGDSWRVIGGVYMDTDDKIHANGAGYQRGNMWMYNIPITITTTLSSGTWSAATSCATAIPAISTLGIFGLEATCTGAGNVADVFIRPAGSTWATNYRNGIAGVNCASGQRICITSSTQTINYQSNSVQGGDTVGIDVEGYYLDIR